MAKVTYKRVQTNDEVSGIPVLDGQLIYSKQGKTFMDYGTDRVPINGTTDSAMSDSSTNPVENRIVKSYVDTQINNLFIPTAQILWTNPDPTASISTDTTITLSSDDYDVLECFFITANDNFDVDSCRTLKGYNFNLSSTGYQGMGLRRRISYNSDTSYTISPYNGEPTTDQNRYVIPQMIIGYKYNINV